ncbi:hypothetical protein J6590_092141 [Homalodisca vitripennis]|nr:hypothetical protein J6590_092141 [Homalodisca vitripennis]
MALINQKSPCETSDDWRDEIRKSRSKPEPFVVIDCKQDMFYSWNENLSKFFPKSCPFPTRPLRELKVTKEEVGHFLHRDSFSGAFTASSVLKKPVRRSKQVKTSSNPNVEPTPYNTDLLKPMYAGPLPVSQAKFQDLMHLKRFCNPVGKEFLENITPAIQVESESEVDDEDN